MKWLVLAALTGCSMDLGTAGQWRDASGIAGDLAPSIGDAPMSAAPATGSLRVVTYNIKDGGIAPDALADLLLADPDLSLADVVLLQECEAFPDEAAPRVATLAQRLGMGWFYAPARPQAPGTFGNAIVSRFPLSNLAEMNLGHASGKLQRIAIAADLDVGGATVHVITTQLDTTLNITKRVLQLHPIVIDTPEVTIVGGDFNTNPYLWDDGQVPVLPESVVVETDQAPLLDDYMAGLGFANQTAGLGPTEVRYGFSSRLDAIYARGVDVSGGAVVRSIDVSDHWPVWVDVKIRP